MSVKSQLARLEALAQERLEATRPKEIFRNVTVFEGVPLAAKQQRHLDYNRSLKNPARVGFSVIRIQPQPERCAAEAISAEIKEASELEH